MFRKPKRKVKNTLRKKEDEALDEEDATNTEESTTELLDEARKRAKTGGSNSTAMTATSASSVMHTYETKEPLSSRDLVTSTAEHHPKELLEGGWEKKKAAAPVDDGIFRADTTNSFHAGPIRAAAHVRVTARFDYQPDICKDYKETGFCGFGDTCIYLHDRGDTMTGWQLEQQWEEQQKAKKAKQEKEMLDFASGKKQELSSAAALPEDGIPFACHVCREPFKQPVVTNCLHYFCEKCVMDHVRNISEVCPICGKDTGSVFNMPTKLIAKKKKLLGASESNAEDSWEQYAKLFVAAAARSD